MQFLSVSRECRGIRTQNNSAFLNNVFFFFSPLNVDVGYYKGIQTTIYAEGCTKLSHLHD